MMVVMMMMSLHKCKFSPHSLTCWPLPFLPKKWLFEKQSVSLWSQFPSYIIGVTFSQISPGINRIFWPNLKLAEAYLEWINEICTSNIKLNVSVNCQPRCVEKKIAWNSRVKKAALFKEFLWDNWSSPSTPTLHTTGRITPLESFEKCLHRHSSDCNHANTPHGLQVLREHGLFSRCHSNDGTFWRMQ